MTAYKKITGVLAAAGITVLILDSKTAMSGAAAGLDLCIKTVVPSLFPFLFLCAVLTNTLWGSKTIALNQLCRKLGIPSGAESILISASLGGYPAGAQVIGTAYKEGKLSKSDAEHLLTFCSNAGPAFLFGMTSTLFPNKSAAVSLWCIQILASFLTAITGKHRSENTARLSAVSISLSAVLAQTVRTMSTICGWVMLFRILSVFLEKWILFYFPNEIQIITAGILELSNGCCALNGIENVSLRFILCSCFLSFGGLCVLMQTVSVIDKLSLYAYLKGKRYQTFFSFVLSCLYLKLGWSILLGVIAFICFYCSNLKIRCGFPSVKRV